MSPSAALAVRNTCQAPAVLTINAGSSSIKFAHYTAQSTPQLLLRGHIENIGSPAAVFALYDGENHQISARSVTVGDHLAAVELLLDWIENGGYCDVRELIGIGHRIVHGGPNFHTPQRVTSRLLNELRQLTALDRAHLPQEIRLIEALQQRFPQLSQVACFDTGFHHNLPHLARLLPIPRHYGLKGVRRYGFHGLSYEFLMAELRRLDATNATHGRVVVAHLGNGSSLAAVHAGQPIDTSMGFTPASGVMMGTRSGDIDPGLACYLARTDGMDTARFDDMVNTKSGLLGVSETSADIRELLTREGEDPRAADAVALYCYQIKKCIGAYAAALGGLDSLIFSGGIGENAAVIRSRICQGLGFLGVVLDPERNQQNAGVISAEAAHVTVRVIRTNEELVIAEAACQLLGSTKEALAKT